MGKMLGHGRVGGRVLPGKMGFEGNEFPSKVGDDRSLPNPLISVVLTIMLAFLVSACGRAQIDSDSVCIPPVAELAYPLGIPKPLDAKAEEISPKGGWQLQASLPESLGDYLPQIAIKEKEIWILANMANKVFRYQADTDGWKSYNTIDDYPVAPRNIFVSHGTVWGLGQIFPDFDSVRDYPFLSYYNATTDQFEFVTDVDGILDNVSTLSDPMEVTSDSVGLLWMFVYGEDDVGLYSFNPETRKAEKHISLKQGALYYGPAIAPNGDIWFVDGWEDRLAIYSPVTHESQLYYGVPSLERVGIPEPLYFDREGRLWLSNKGWLDFKDPANPVWYEIIPSAVFLTENGEFLIDILEGPRARYSRYGWVEPSEIYQSSNGWYWFTADGIIRLDPQKAEWCRFTTGRSPVVEDKDGYLWIVVYDKLYKYDLEP